MGPSSPNRRLYIHPTYAYISEVSGLALIFIEPFSHGGTVHEERYLSRQLEAEPEGASILMAGTCGVLLPRSLLEVKVQNIDFVCKIPVKECLCHSALR